MRKGTKTILIITITVIVTFLATSYVTRRVAFKVLANAVVKMEAFNEIGRVESWDRMEKLLVGGCTKEALALVRIEQNIALTDIKRSVGSDAELVNMLKDRNPEVAKRVESVVSKGSYSIPTCSKLTCE